MPQNIFIFSSVHPYNDVRVFHKEAISLAKKYHVELHIPAQFKEKTIQNVRIKGLPSTSRRYTRWVNNLLLCKRAMFSKADIFHFHDPELIPLGLFIKLLKRKPVIYDVHEDYATSIKLKTYLPSIIKKPMAKIFRFFETWAMRRFDITLFAENYYKTLYKSHFLYEDIYNYPIEYPNSKKDNSSINLIYAGTITKARGIYNILDFYKYLSHDLHNYKLFIIGKIYDDSIISAINKYKDIEPFSNTITVIGKQRYVDHSVIRKYFQQAHVGLALFDFHPHYNRKLLTKFYEYMNAGLFLVISDFPLWKSFIQQHDCGMIVNTKSLREAAQLFEKNIPYIKNKSQKGLAQASLYNWKTEEKKLLSIYEGLLK